jgi:hypothetical protein
MNFVQFSLVQMNLVWFSSVQMNLFWFSSVQMNFVWFSSIQMNFAQFSSNELCLVHFSSNECCLVQSTRACFSLFHFKWICFSSVLLKWTELSWEELCLFSSEHTCFLLSSFLVIVGTAVETPLCAPKLCGRPTFKPLKVYEKIRQFCFRGKNHRILLTEIAETVDFRERDKSWRNFSHVFMYALKHPRRLAMGSASSVRPSSWWWGSLVSPS